MLFDWTVRIDTLATMAAMMGGALVVWGALKSDLKTVMRDVAALKVANDKQTIILIEMARQDQQLKDHDRRISKLETQP